MKKKGTKLRFFIQKKFIPRSNFNAEITPSKFTKSILYNFVIRSFFIKIFKFLSFIKKDNFISRFLGNRLYFYQSALELKKCSKSNTKIFQLDLSFNTRRVNVINGGEKFEYIFKNNSYSKIKFGVALLENEFLVKKDNFNFDLYCKVLLSSKKKNKNYSFQIPLKNKKHAIINNIEENQFFDFFVDLNDFVNEEIKITVSFKLNESSFLMFGKNLQNFKFINSKSVAISTRLVNNFLKKKIIIFSCESLANYKNLEIKYKKKLNLKNLDYLIDNYENSKNSFSACDATLPNISSMHTGLMPSQHACADHYAPWYEGFLNENIKLITDYTLKNKFYNCAFVAGGRFDTFKDWTKGYHQVFKTINPASDKAPNIQRLKNFVDHNLDDQLFIYFHNDRLHAPVIKQNLINTPSIQNISEISEAYNNHNFYPIYFQQLKKLDDDIGDLIFFLKDKKIYDQTLLILTADHGPSLPPLWKKYSGDSLYFEHTNIPLIIKNADWSKIKIKSENYLTTHPFIFKSIVESLNEDLPEYFINLPQFKEEFKQIAFTETIHIPKKNNFNVRFSYSGSSFVAKSIIDWNNYNLKKILESNDINKDQINLLNKYINLNLEFRKKYQPRNFFN